MLSMCWYANTQAYIQKVWGGVCNEESVFMATTYIDWK